MVLQLQLWQLPLLMCLAGLLLSDICRGEHLAQIQDGPLYRVKGYPISISCNVSGYMGQADQGFAFSVYKSDFPEREIKIVSTFDPQYAYAAFTRRVRDKGITIERLSKTSVVLHFQSLFATDAGIYECYTPNAFEIYEGTYNSKTTLNVIEDTLKASYSGLASYRISEGESLQLECEVSSQTMQHTHLSVTWCLRGSTETVPIISLDRDLSVRPGAAFEEQYRLGFISMEKVEDTTYRLKMTQVQQSASGEIYCQAEEWIQDPDRSWIRIAHKNTTASNVEIKAVVTEQEGSFTTAIEGISGILQEGEKAVIRCTVQAQNLPDHFFSITWLKNNIEVARIGPSGVLRVAPNYIDREKEGELTAVKISDNAYALTIRPARAKDEGQYWCKATQAQRTESGGFTPGKSQLSSEITVHIKAKESGLAVDMAKEVDVTEGVTLKLTCSVSGARGPLSVSWQHKKASSISFRDVISLTHEGVRIGAQYQDRIVRTFRSTTANFTLEIGGSVLSDSGEYKCTVSEWNMDSSGSMKEVISQSSQVLVSVKSIESLLNVVLISRDSNVTENSVVTMICTVKGPQVPLDVYWKFTPSNSKAQKDIICMFRDGAISCGKEQKDYQLEANKRETGTVFSLRMLRIRKRQQGTYQCQVTAYQESVQKAQKSSNQIAVHVHSPGSKMSLSLRPKPRLDIPVKSNAKFDCSVTSAVSNSSRFAVTWKAGSLMLVTMSPEGVITLGPAVNQEMDQRISMLMTQRQTFQLAIQKVKTADSGQYQCLVEEWIQDPDGIWYPLKTESATTELVVKEQASDFSLNKSDIQLVVTEGMQVDLRCSLPSKVDATVRYSLIWFLEKQDQQFTVPLVTYNQDGRLQFSGQDLALQHRLSFSRPTIDTFYLSILNSSSSDSGRYHCQVNEYQLDCKGNWEYKAGDMSGFTTVSVNLLENKLQVQKGNRNFSVADHRAGFTVECEIISRSSDKSKFEVTWSKSQKDGHPITIFTAKRDGTLHNAIGDKAFIYSHPKTTLYRLTVPDVGTSDSGQYQCQVGEWLQTATSSWRKVAEDKSGELFVHVESKEKPSTETFALKEPKKNLRANIGEQFVLDCSILVDKVDPSFHYTVTWMLKRQNNRNVLLRHSYDGRMQYQSEDQQLNSRLQFFRPTVTDFQLTVFNSQPTDSGTYECMVQQYRLGCEGTWKSIGSEQIISTEVTVHDIERKLQVNKESRSLNLTGHAGFNIECEIISRSSDKSVFTVTWFKSSSLFFSVQQDGILKTDFSHKDLVYQHPSANVYILTVPRVDPSDNGQYKCQVEEWLPDPRRIIAEDDSGELSVHVHVEVGSDKSRQQDCSSGTILGILIPLLCILLVVIALLLITVQKTKSASKKQKDSMWPENNPLKVVPESTDY